NVLCATRGGSCSDGYFLFLSSSQHHHFVSRRDVLILSRWLTLRWALLGTLTITRKKRRDLVCWASGALPGFFLRCRWERSSTLPPPCIYRTRTGSKSRFKTG